MTHRMLKKLTFGTLLLVLVGCDKPTLYIESDTVWTGRVIGSSSTSEVEGTGNKTYKLRSGQTCWSFTKATEQGRLRVFAKIRGNRTNGDDRTTQPFGTVNGCV